VKKANEVAADFQSERGEPPPLEGKTEPYRIQGGGVLIFTTRGKKERRRPCVVLGSFGDGTPCLHFRQYALQQPGFLAPTRFGISLTLPELNDAVERIRKVVSATVPVEDDSVEVPGHAA
jgi:hypothetical protein